MTAATGSSPVTRGDRARTVLRGTGELLITLGLVVLLFCAYELWVTGITTAHDQKQLGRDLTRTWAATPPSAPLATPAPVAPPPLGDAYARFYLPSLHGANPTVIVEGVGVPDLKKGPGHWPQSAAPGQIGNLVFSGHRTTYGAPFGDLGELHTGDALIVETADTWFTYRVTGSEVVLPNALQVTLPVPDSPGAVPTQAVITLTTCTPKFSARQRLVIHGLLQATLPKSAGQPPALTGA